MAAAASMTELVSVMSRRLSWRSMTTPAQAPSRSVGANWIAVSRPSAVPLSVSRYTSSVWAASWTQVPVKLMPWVTKKIRKFRCWSDRNVSAVASLKRVTDPPPRG